MLDDTLWGMIGKGVHANEALPTWAHHICNLDLDELNLKSAISFELVEVTESYLFFLKEQIELNTRGDEWSGILSQRVERLLPHIGKELLHIRVEEGLRRLWIQFEPIHAEVVTVEWYGD